MYRRALAPARQLPSALRRAATPPTRAGTRFLSTASPASKSRSWRNAALRWGAAGAAVYWYNTSPLFAEEPAPRTIPAPPQFSDDDFKTVDAVIEEKRLRTSPRKIPTEPTPAPVPASSTTDGEGGAASTDETTMATSPEALEEEAGQEGAFNPETGEINWDCPCLGGMANGPCGEEFKTAFSCFVFSKEEPKGMDCIEKFQGMQECFRKYPEIYGAELADDEADDEAAAAAVAADPAPGGSTPSNDDKPALEAAKVNSSAKKTEPPASRSVTDEKAPKAEPPKPAAEAGPTPAQATTKAAEKTVDEPSKKS